MEDSHGRDGVSKMIKLTGADDLINWNRRVKAYLQQSEIELLGLTYLPDQAGSTQHSRWLKANVREKSTITLTFADRLFAQVNAIQDDGNKTAKNLWQELE